MLFVSFSSALAYLVGANDISTLLGGTTKKHDTGSKATFDKAIYANKEELARVSKVYVNQATGGEANNARLLRSYVLSLAKML
jgi:ribosomal protein L5